MEDVFAFTGYRWDPATATASFRYRLDIVRDANGAAIAGPEEFTETVSFTVSRRPEGTALPDASPGSGFDRLLVLAGAVLGLSYLKAGAPVDYRIDPAGLSEPALAFLRAALRDGMAEFAYRNGLPGPLQPRIELSAGLVPAWEPQAFDAQRALRPLVALGGGKDSVVSAELLRRAGFQVRLVATNPNGIIDAVAARSGLPLLRMRRTIDPRLLELNAAGARNGHVPVTAMNTLLSVAQAQLAGLGPAVFSNESSAGEETLSWDGFPVNHQWSKGPEAELLLAEAIAAQLGVAGASFSLLRAFTELRIARIYATLGEQGGARYDDVIVSCNRAYRISGAAPSWCGECDKCRFVFLAFAPFMPRERLLRILGRDLFAAEANIPGYAALLGLDEAKPFECVGEIRESQVALSLALRQPHWRDSPVAAAMLDRLPALADAADAFGAEVLGLQPSPALPDPRYAEARDAAA